MAQHKFDRGWDTYKHAEVHNKWAVTQKELKGAKGGPHYKVVYYSHMQEIMDREASSEEEAPTLDPRDNYPNGAHSPQGYLSHKPGDDYGPSSLYDGLVAEATVARAP